MTFDGRVGIRSGSARGKALVIAAIIIVAVVFVTLNMVHDRNRAKVNTAVGSEFFCNVISVYDGDGPINCSDVDLAGKPVQVRLRGIEARESDNSCRPGIVCPKATGAQAKAELTRLAVGRIRCRSFGPSYGRVDASCTNSAGVDLSCALVKSRHAVRWPQYDPEGRLVACEPGKG